MPRELLQRDCDIQLRTILTNLGKMASRLNISSADKREQRKAWLSPPPGEYKIPDNVDSWEKTGEGVYLEPVARKMKLD